MTARTIPGVEVSSGALAQRALELAHDRGLPLGDAVQHLLHLAGGRLVLLGDALSELRGGEQPRAEIDHACILLRSAIGAAATPPFFGGAPGTRLPG
jgi:hypothetical protein